MTTASKSNAVFVGVPRGTASTVSILISPKQPHPSGDLRAFGGHRPLNSGTRQHPSAMVDDPGDFGGVDAVTFYPGCDGEKIGIADRIMVAHDPWAPQQLIFDEREAIRHVRRDLAFHCLNGCRVVRPPCAPHAMGVSNVHGRAKITIELLNLGEGKRIIERSEVRFWKTLRDKAQ